MKCPSSGELGRTSAVPGARRSIHVQVLHWHGVSKGRTTYYTATKIIPRFSKKRRLGRLTVSLEETTKREVAILKKVRHPNVVGLLEIIDDQELKKITLYLVLEHVELGEVVWRKEGDPQICLYERQRIERDFRGEKGTGDDEKLFKALQRRRQREEAQRARISQLQLAHGHVDFLRRLWQESCEQIIT